MAFPFVLEVPTDPGCWVLYYQYNLLSPHIEGVLPNY